MVVPMAAKGGAHQQIAFGLLHMANVKEVYAMDMQTMNRSAMSRRKCRTYITGMVLVLGVSQSAFGQDMSAGRWIDLTHPFSEQTIYWPTADGFVHSVVSEGVTDNGYYYSAYNFSAAEHGGTHLDAPIHFVAGRKSVDELPVEQLIGAAIVIDVADKAHADRDYQVAVADLQHWEAQHGRIPDQCIVLIHTGSSRHWPDRRAYMGTDERGASAVRQLHFPGLHPDAARWLVDNRSIKAIGLDTPSIDFGQSTLFESHRILFERDIPALENVANLEALPPTGATIIALPMKIAGGSGAPTRIVAFLPE
jgi:kynurenine formamidase